MRYYKYIENHYIVCIGKGACGDAISEEEYGLIKEKIKNRPKDTDRAIYRLREDLTWEEYEVEPSDTDPDIDDAEALQIIFGGEEE